MINSEYSKNANQFVVQSVSTETMQYVEMAFQWQSTRSGPQQTCPQLHHGNC